MYDVSKEFDKFYKDHVILGGMIQQELRRKKDVNIKHLVNGLEEYNEENKTSYVIAETRVQGSMAMATVVQNDDKDYDIDVAIVFDKSNLGDLGSLQARRLVCNALKKKSGQLSVEPEVKTNCVRIQYAEGYHVDFAVYRRYKEEGNAKYTYEHAGAEWKRRDPAAITRWFLEEVKEKGTELRKIVRLSKMFCKSRDTWVNMPGGLLQSVLCDEVFANEYDRIDEIFYHTMVGIRDRLKDSLEVNNPTDSDISLLTAQNHYAKMSNWLSRLDGQLDNLDILLDEECTQKQALEAWGTFFNHDYWNEEAETLFEATTLQKAWYTDTEEYIEDMVPINDCYEVHILKLVRANGFQQQRLERFLEQYPVFERLIPHGLEIQFKAETDVPKPYDVWWKVRNVGSVAERKNKIRGQIEKQWKETKIEHSRFEGPHYVECYIIKNKECVAIRRVDVSIGRQTL